MKMYSVQIKSELVLEFSCSDTCKVCRKIRHVLCCKFHAEYHSERILKIGQYLTKL